jgi:hypothetical protein
MRRKQTNKNMFALSKSSIGIVFIGHSSSRKFPKNAGHAFLQTHDWRPSTSFWAFPEQGYQIGRIFAHLAIIYFMQNFVHKWKQ